MTAIRVGIAVLLTFSVLAHGAVETWSQSLLEIGASLLLLWWGVLAVRRGRFEWAWSPLYLPMLAFGGLILLQWLSGLSVYPHATKVEFWKLAADFLLFFLLVQSVRTTEETHGFVWFLLVLGFAVALFGIIQHFTFNGMIYWFRDPRYRGMSFGPYVNRNHFAGLMELILPVGLALLFLRGVRRDRLPLLAPLTLIPIGALLLSGSRGGILTFFFQFVLLAFLVQARAGARKVVPLVFALVLLGGAFAAWLGAGENLGRFAQLGSAEVAYGQRFVILKDSGRIFLDHPVVGTGLGTLVTVYPQYESVYHGKLVDHAHNDYVELLAETGLLGGLCALGFILLFFRLARRRLQTSVEAFDLSLRTGALVACTGLLLHSLVDFNFHIPSNALLFFLLAQLATRADRAVTE